MIPVKFKFPKVIHPKDDTGTPATPVLHFELRALPQVGASIYFDGDVNLQMVKSNKSALFERYENVFGSKALTVESILHIIEKTHLVVIYLKSPLP